MRKANAWKERKRYALKLEEIGFKTDKDLTKVILKRERA